MWEHRQPNRFVIGANLPWIDYGADIGSNAWHPDGGLGARPESLARLDRTLAALAADGVRVVRVFLLCDARSGVRFDAAGWPLGLDETAWADLDALFTSARDHGIGLMPVLFDFHLCSDARIVNGVQLGGRARLVADPAARGALLERVVAPIAERYGSDDAVAAWDVMNEPEWCLKRRRRPRARVTFDAMQRFLAGAVESVRRRARQPVTVGCAGTWRLDLVRPLGLDFYEVHWYERFGRAALERPVADLDLGHHAVILGEFPGRTASVADVLDAAKRAGYEGALLWSVLADDDQSAYPPELSACIRAQAGPHSA
jgi:sugar phosphate isomerase/epimerase